MTITLITPPLSVDEAEGLGKALGQYKITVTGLSVVHVWADGSRHRDDPAARTIRDTAGSIGTGLAITPAAVPLLGLVPVLPLPALILGLAASIGGLFATNKRMCDPRAVQSEITFGFGNVSPKRAAWAEYIIGAYCALHGWRPAVPTRNTHSGAAYAARQQRLPPAWGR